MRCRAPHGLASIVAYIYATDIRRRQTPELHDEVYLPRVMATLARSLRAVHTRPLYIALILRVLVLSYIYLM